MAVTRNDPNYGGMLASGTINVASVYNWATPENISNIFHKKYGDQTARVQMELAGRTFPVVGNYPFVAHEEDNRLHRKVSVGESNTSGSWSGSGVNNPLQNTITLSSDDVVDMGNGKYGCYIREGQSAWIKQSDGSMPELYVESIDFDETTTDPPEVTFYAFDASSLEDVSAGDEIILGNINYGEDSGQPTAVQGQMFEHEFYPFEAKETLDATADVMAKQFWFEKQIGGYPSLYNMNFLKTEQRLNIHEDLKAFMGQRNTNGITGEGRNGTTPTIHSGEGYWQRANRLGGTLPFQDFSVQLVDQIETYWESYHVTNKSGIVFGGSGLGRDINKAGLDLLQQYSMSDLMTNPGGTSSEIRANIKVFQYGDITIGFQPLTIFNDPTMFGSQFNHSGLLIPNETVTDARSNTERGNIGLGYEAHNDVDRKRVIGMHPGMSGRHPNNGTVSHENTSDQVYFASKLMPYLMAVNQMIVLRGKGE